LTRYSSSCTCSIWWKERERERNRNIRNINGTDIFLIYELSLNISPYNVLICGVSR
jgi:hypothetical protein